MHRGLRTCVRVAIFSRPLDGSQSKNQCGFLVLPVWAHSIYHGLSTLRVLFIFALYCDTMSDNGSARDNCPCALRPKKCQPVARWQRLRQACVSDDNGLLPPSTIPLLFASGNRVMLWLFFYSAHLPLPSTRQRLGQNRNCYEEASHLTVCFFQPNIVTCSIVYFMRIDVCWWTRNYVSYPDA